MNVWSNPTAYVGKVIQANHSYKNILTKGRIYPVADVCITANTFQVLGDHNQLIWLCFTRFDPIEPSDPITSHAAHPSIVYHGKEGDVIFTCPPHLPECPSVTSDVTPSVNTIPDTSLDNLIEAIFRQIENDQAIHRSSLKAVLVLHLKR